MISAVKLERYVINISIFDIIIGKLCYKKKSCLIILLKVNKNLKVSFYYTILPLFLAVYLWVEFVMIRSLFLAYHIYGLMIRIASSVSCVRYILFYVIVYIVIAGRWRTIYFSYFVSRFLFFLSTFLDFIYLSKSNLFLWDPDRN